MKISITLLLAIGISFSSMNLHAESNDKLIPIEQKLDLIVLPSLKMKNESIRSAVQTLRELAQQNSQDGKGINIFLRTTDINSSDTITLEMQKPTLREAVTEVAKQSGMKLKIDSVAVSLN